MSKCIRLAALGVALSAAAGPAAGSVFVFSGENASAQVNPNDTQFYSSFDLHNGPAAYGYGQTSDVEVGWSASASSGGSAVTGPSGDTTVNFGAAASGSAQAHAKHGHLKAAAGASADVRPGQQFVQYAGGPVAVRSPLSAGATGAIEVGYQDQVTVSNPSLGTSDWVTLNGTLHLHAGITMDNASMASALAETTLQFFGTYAKLDGSDYFNASQVTLTRQFSQGTWVTNDLNDVDFTIEVLNGVSFGIMQTLKVSATAGANYANDYSSALVDAMNTATLVFTPVGEGTQITTASGVTYAVPEPGCLGLTSAAVVAMAARRRR